jgi:hypothetical protein
MRTVSQATDACVPHATNEELPQFDGAVTLFLPSLH